MRSLRLAALALGLLAVLGPAVARAAEPMPLAPDLQIPLILKILTYDRYFERKAGSDLAIGIVYAPLDPASVAVANQVTETLYRFSGKTVKRLPIRYHLIEYTGPEAFDRTLAARGTDVIYVAPGNARNLDGMLKVAKARGITTTTGVPDYVRRGVSVGLGVSGDRPQIFINLPESRIEGSEFDASLLRIATVLK